MTKRRVCASFETPVHNLATHIQKKRFLTTVNEDVKSSNRDKFILFLEDWVRDMKIANSNDTMTYKNDTLFNILVYYILHYLQDHVVCVCVCGYMYRHTDTHTLPQDVQPSCVSLQCFTAPLLLEFFFPSFQK